jgi:integrase
LRWHDVDENTIYIRAGSAKTRSHRMVTITLNLRSWIADFPRNSGRITIFWSRRAFRDAIKKAHLLPWQEDCLRHSFGSYWLALHHDENKLAQEMGNSPKVIVTNYRRPVTVKAAKEYFNVRPS